MASFMSLPSELRSTIYALALPSSININIKECADLMVTSIPSTPALFTTTKETRAAAQKWALKPYSILIGDNYTDIMCSEDITLHLNIIPSTAERLSITWAELYTTLGDALLDAQRIVIECSKPDRLARLFMLPEAELLAVGSSSVEKGLFDNEVIAADHNAREALRPDVVISVGEDEYRMEEVKGGRFFGEKAPGMKRLSKTSAPCFRDVDFPKSKEACALDVQGEEVQLNDEKPSGRSELPCVPETEVELRSEEGPGEKLTEEALGRLCAEMKKLFPGGNSSGDVFSLVM